MGQTNWVKPANMIMPYTPYTSTCIYVIAAEDQDTYNCTLRGKQTPKGDTDPMQGDAWTKLILQHNFNMTTSQYTEA